MREVTLEECINQKIKDYLWSVDQHNIVITFTNHTFTMLSSNKSGLQQGVFTPILFDQELIKNLGII